MEAQAQL